MKRFFTMCHECLKTFEDDSFIVFDFNDDLIVDIKCPMGHSYKARINDKKFELFLQSGAVAFINEYYHEALFNFIVARERFFEFCIRFFCKKLDIKIDVVEKNFKHIENSSERQIGAFLFLYLLHFKKSYPFKMDDVAKVRNGLFHKGKIYSPKEVKETCKLIYDEIYEVVEQLVLDTGDLDLFHILTSKIQDDIENNLVHSYSATISMCAIFFSLDRSREKSFYEAIERFKTIKKYHSPTGHQISFPSLEVLS